MEQPVPSVVREPRFPLPDPIGEVHVLVYGWERGKTEVRVKFPDEPASGNPDAATKQAEFRSLVLAEVDDCLRR
jgi:hypothetical protein